MSDLISRQDVPDTNVGDMISRQAAIDRFNVIRPVDPKKDEYTKGIDVGIAMCIVAVKDQPTIQPVATDTNVGDSSEMPNSSDCISRQAAIDATYAETVSTNPEHFKSSKKFIGYMDDIDISDFGRWQWANGFNTALVAIKIKLEKLPSAESERKKGKWIPNSPVTMKCDQCGLIIKDWDWHRFKY